jgi:LmbE family N-acetylglucosaminyl deacetylase
MALRAPIQTLLLLGVSLVLVSTANGVPPERVLVFAPHPDDEALACTGVLRRAVIQDQAVKVVIMTAGDAHTRAKKDFESSFPDEASDRDGDGDFDMIDFGIVRHEESIAALGLIGVAPEDIIFLAYPDAGIDDLWNGAKRFTSPFTGQSEVPDAYDFAFRVGAPYSRDACLADVSKVIREFKPTLIFSPRPTDTHQDHWALGKFVSQALMQLYDQVQWKAHFGYLIHWEKIQPDWPGSGADWSPPTGQAPPVWSLQLADFGFSAEEKCKVIDAFRSQVNVSGPYLRAFSKDSEIFWLESLGPAASDVSELLVPGKSDW